MLWEYNDEIKIMKDFMFLLIVHFNFIYLTFWLNGTKLQNDFRIIINLKKNNVSKLMQGIY